MESKTFKGKTFEKIYRRQGVPYSALNLKVSKAQFKRMNDLGINNVDTNTFIFHK